jgi:hypothetical protein
MPVIVEDIPWSKSKWETRTIAVENRKLRFLLFPDLGAKIYSLVHKATGKEILWQNPNLSPREASPDICFDDSWSGGWDELFPNDEPATLDGRTFPDHGDLWKAKWECDIETSGEEVVVHLQTECPTSGCRVEKSIKVAEGEDRIRFNHRITNLENRPLQYLWKLHPAFAVSPGDRILVPASRFRLEPLCLGSLGGGELEWKGPLLRLPNRTVDIRMVPSRESQELFFYYGLDLAEGWCAVYDCRNCLAVGLSFPKQLFSSCWLFASYGGWREHFVAVLEPCTGYPFRLEDAHAQRQCATLPPLGQQEAIVIFSMRQGVDGVSRISPDGSIE